MKRRACNFYSVLIGALILLIFCMGLGTFIASAHENTEDTIVYKYYKSIQIQPGDTLWDIAAEYGPADRDIRSVIWDICEINGISAEQLTAGQRIIVPVYQ